MDPFEARLKSLPLRQPSAEFGAPETLAASLRRRAERRSLMERIRNMSWKSKAAAICGLAASVVVAYLALAGATGGSVAFAQVAEKLRSARTLSYDWVLKRDADGKTLGKGRNLYMVPGRIRIEYGGEQDKQTYVVFDSPGGKVLFVDENQKTARVMPLTKSEGIDKAAKAIESVRSLNERRDRSLGNTRIDGVEAKGFEIDRDNETTTVWANATSGDPMRLEILEKNNPDGPTLQVWTNIKLDQRLDPKLFSVVPPTGFRVTQSLPANVDATPADFVAGFLKIYTKYMEGQFPRRLQDASKELGEKLKPPQPSGPPSDEMMQLVFYSVRIAAVTNRGKEGEDWQYYGGHALGEKDEVIFWFHDRQKRGYWAVFGDLRVEKVSPAQLPSAPAKQPANQ